MDKVCRNCCEAKPPEYFSAGKNLCRECQREYANAYYHKNKAIINSRNKQRAQEVDTNGLSGNQKHYWKYKKKRFLQNKRTHFAKKQKEQIALIEKITGNPKLLCESNINHNIRVNPFLHPYSKNLKIVIYKITNIANGKFYIGSTSNYSHRLALHRSRIGNKDIHKNPLYEDMRLLGWGNFSKEIICMCTQEARFETESICLKNEIRIRGEELAYNIMRCDNIRAHDDLSKAKMSRLAISQGRKPSKEAIQKSALLRGKPVIAYSLDNGEFVGWYRSTRQAELDLNVFNISRQIQGLRSFNQYKFVYAETR